MHADAAAVNVNFWLTPDDANLDPDGGGLVVWDKEAPLSSKPHFVCCLKKLPRYVLICSLHSKRSRVPVIEMTRYA